MTDLKAANQMLAQAIAALESPEHDADVSEAEAIRNRLLDLDAAIGARIQAKLDAHRLIVESWGKVEPASMKAAALTAEWTTTTMDAMLNRNMAGTTTIGYGIEAPLDGMTADAWEAHHEEHTGKYALSGDEVPDPVLMNGAAESVAEIQQEQ